MRAGIACKHVLLIIAAMLSSYWVRYVLIGGILIAAFGQWGLPGMSPLFQAEGAEEAGHLNFSISGEVRREQLPVGGVRLWLYAATNPNIPLQSTTTSPLAGTYRFTEVAAGEYVVRPEDERYSFSPLQHEVQVRIEDVTAVDFLATLVGVGAGGRISDAADTGIPDISVSLYQDNSDFPVATTQSNETGLYGFPNLEPGTYQVKPATIGYSFTPEERTFTISTTQIITLNFLANNGVPTYIVSGRVLDKISGLEGVTLTLTSENIPIATAVTDREGTYSFAGVTQGVYRITPLYKGYSFTPPDQEVMVTRNTLLELFRAEPVSEGNAVLYLPLVRRR
jgi:hypothetical protein